MQNYRGNSQQRKTHPAVIAAGVAVVLFCAVGTAAIMGWIPGSDNESVPPTPMAASAPAKPAAPAVRQVQGSRQSTHAASVPAASMCGSCGVVESTRAYATQGQGSGLGAAGGAVV